MSIPMLMSGTPKVPELPVAALVEDVMAGVRDYALFVVRPGGEIGDWGAGGEAVTGYPAEEILGRPLSVLWADDRIDDLSAVLRRASERGSVTVEGSSVRRDGSKFWSEETLSVIRRGDEVVGFVGILRDATERRRREEALGRAKATFEGILAIASDAVVSVSESQRITFFNQGAEAIFGYTAEEAIGEPLDILIPPDARSIHPQHIRNFARTDVEARRMGERGEITGRRKDGEIFPAEASISKLEVGGVRVFTAVLRDVTEQRRAEEESIARALELERSNAELEQFAYVASHDLQEPLRMVASYTQLLARRYKGQLDEDADEFIAYATDGVQRMRELINDLLAYSRAGAFRGDRVSMEAVLDGVLQDLQTTIMEAGATVTSDPLPVVWGDHTQLAQLLQNLVGNAIKFRSDEPPVVRISARRQHREWLFAVQDNGIGIDPEFSDRIFMMFQRLHARTEYPGTGIGLSICQKIVHVHGGKIWVVSVPDRGSTFYFTLPIREEVDP